MDTYIKSASLFRKMNSAKQMKQNLYIYGATGYGKTELIRQYFQNHQYIYVLCSQNDCDLSEVKKNTRNFPVVIDNVNAIQDEPILDELLDICNQNKFWVIIVGRSKMPSWLFDTFVSKHMALITEDELMFTEENTDSYMKNEGINLAPDELSFVTEHCQGNPFMIQYTAQMILSGKNVDRIMLEENSILFQGHLEKCVISELSSELYDFLLRISIVDDFTTELAAVMMGDSGIQAFIEQAMDAGNFIVAHDGVYRIKMHMLKALRNKAIKEISESELSTLSLIAGRYYEAHEYDDKALDIYVRYNRAEYIQKLLIKNARKNPESGHFVGMRKHYLMLSDEEIRSNIYLMSAMSMLYSMLLNFDKSEYWYQELKKFSESAAGKEKKESLSLLAYLDIGLPGRGSVNILQIIKSYYTLLRKNAISMPAFSVTSNLPSIMNGGKDFCEWSKNDKKIATTAGGMVSALLGKYGKGLVNACLAESTFEKGGNPFDVFSRISKAKIEAEAGGKTELSFAATGTLFRQYIVLGEADNAAILLDSFACKAEKESLNKINPQIEAMRCRLALLSGDTATAKNWLETAPDENEEFIALYRYLYLTKIRCYLALEQYDRALMLIESLKYYAEKCDRKMILMELGIMTSILLYRMKLNWKPEFEKTLELICEYKFIPTITEYGSAVHELLKQCEGIAETNNKIDSDWFEKVLKRSGKVARFYPLYLKTEKKAISELQPMDSRILSCLADGLSIQQTADKLNINYETLRSRIKELYRRIGAKNKTEAVMIAQKSNII